MRTRSRLSTHTGGKPEADGVVHLLSRIPNPEALASARRLRRDLNRLDDVYSDQLADLRIDVAVLRLLAVADQAIRHNETEQAGHYLCGRRGGSR